jgi:hypothetical protein
MIPTYIILIVIFVTQSLSATNWFFHNKLNERFHFSTFEILLKLQEQVYNDVGVDVLIVRFFHNKVTVGISELITKYLAYWESSFLIAILSLSGLFGILCGVWYIYSQKTASGYMLFLCFILAPFIEIFKLPLPETFRFGVFWLIFSVFSLYGIQQFIKSHGKIGGLVVVIIFLLGLVYSKALAGDI